MKKITLVLILFFSLASLSAIASTDVTINNVKYTLYGPDDNPSSNYGVRWGDITYYATIVLRNQDVLIIPSSVTYNGNTYVVTQIRNTLTNIYTIPKVVFEDNVDVVINAQNNTSSAEYIIKGVKELHIGKNVRIRSKSSGFGCALSLDNSCKIYSTDEVPLNLLSASPYLKTNSSLVYCYTFHNLNSYQNSLYVPIGAGKTYRAAIGWSLISTIIEDESLGDVSNNAAGVELINVQANYGNAFVGIVNQDTDIPIVLNTTSKIKSFQLKVKLPEKINLVGDLTEAVLPYNENISLEVSQSQDGSLTISGTAAEALETGKNILLNIKVKTSWQNTYPIKLSNISLTTPNGETKSIPDSETSLVMQGVRGDMNGDGMVDLSDALYIINLATGLAE